MKLARVSILFLSVAIAFPDDKALSAESDHRPHGPPAVAFDACSEKTAGDPCAVTFGDRTITGTCKTMPQDDRLVCFPDQLPSGPPPDQSGR